MSDEISVFDPPKDGLGYPDMTLDIEKYRPYLAEIEVSEDQAEEFLQILWNMMHTMVNLGLGLDGIQTFLKECEEKAGQDSPQRCNRYQHCRASKAHAIS